MKSVKEKNTLWKPSPLFSMFITILKFMIKKMIQDQKYFIIKATEGYSDTISSILESCSNEMKGSKKLPKILNKQPGTGVFLGILRNFYEHLFLTEQLRWLPL